MNFDGFPLICSSSRKDVQGWQQAVASASQSGNRSNVNTSGRLEMGARGLHCSAADARPVPPSRAVDEPQNEWSKALRKLDVKCSRPEEI